MDREPSIADVDRYISAELPDPSADPLDSPWFKSLWYMARVVQLI